MCRGQLKRGDKTSAHTHMKCTAFGFGPYATIYTVTHCSAHAHTAVNARPREYYGRLDIDAMFVFQVNFGAIGKRAVAICSNFERRAQSSVLIRERGREGKKGRTASSSGTSTSYIVIYEYNWF